jgi:SAM-dependent methyltransferase
MAMPSKFRSIDDAYVARRKAFSEKAGPRELWSVVDHYPLYVGVYTLSRFLAIADLLRSTLDTPGHVVEFGSWRGANLLHLAKLLRIFDPHSMKQVYCFDSFEGLTTFAPQDGSATAHRNMYRGSYEELLEAIALYEMQNEIVIHKGEIGETLPRMLAESPALTFSFAYCDVDLYDPTRHILEQLHGRLSPGGLFVFDEYGFDMFPGETVAVNEFLRDHADQYEVQHVRQTRQPSLALRKRRP